LGASVTSTKRQLQPCLPNFNLFRFNLNTLFQLSLITRSSQQVSETDLLLSTNCIVSNQRYTLQHKLLWSPLHLPIWRSLFGQLALNRGLLQWHFPSNQGPE